MWQSWMVLAVWDRIFTGSTRNKILNLSRSVCFSVWFSNMKNQVEGRLVSASAKNGVTVWSLFSLS